MTREEQNFWYQRRSRILNAYSNLNSGKIGGDYLGYEEIKLEDFLYELKMDGYTENTDISYNINKPASFACSGVRKGDFHGRNFDFFYNFAPTYIVHVNRTLDNKKFIGVVNNNTNVKEKRMLPNIMQDGINECGVVCSIDVVTANDLEDKNIGIPNGSNPSSKIKVSSKCTPCYILARAESAADAIRIMRSINIYGSLEMGFAKEYIQFMISDKDNTFVVNTIDSGLHVMGFKSNKDNSCANKVLEDKHPIMTNFYIDPEYLEERASLKGEHFDFIKGKYTDDAAGIERYDILESNYDATPNTMDGMFNLMKTAQYTRQKEDPTIPNYPFSDVGAGALYGLDEYLEGQQGGKYARWTEAVDSERNKMIYALENNDRTLNIWMTKHNSVYDIKNLKFRFVFEEKYEDFREFSLN